jgi:hypothetical protein
MVVPTVVSPVFSGLKYTPRISLKIPEVFHPTIPPDDIVCYG